MCRGVLGAVSAALGDRLHAAYLLGAAEAISATTHEPFRTGMRHARSGHVRAIRDGHWGMDALAALTAGASSSLGDVIAGVPAQPEYSFVA